MKILQQHASVVVSELNVEKQSKPLDNLLKIENFDIYMMLQKLLEFKEEW